MPAVDKTAPFRAGLTGLTTFKKGSNYEHY
nr:MAG TPA: hypothetical protein [Caudoviricetes sp.]